MAAFAGKQWFRDNITPYLTIIKAELAALGNVTGQYSGKGAAFATLPTTSIEGDPLESGDWSILTSDDIGSGSASAPQYPAGVYVYNSGLPAWELVQENSDIADVLLSIIATPAEVDTGAATDKVASVNQLALKYAKLTGNSSNLFSAASGNIGTQEVIVANQFPATAITGVEAQSDYDGA